MRQTDVIEGYEDWFDGMDVSDLFGPYKGDMFGGDEDQQKDEELEGETPEEDDAESDQDEQDEEATETDDEDDDGFGMETRFREGNVDIENLMYQPSHVNIADDEQVSIVKDGRSVFTGRWDDSLIWIDDNWNDLSGTYSVVKNGMPLYTIPVANNG